MSRATGPGSLALLLFPGTLIAYFGFNSGGLFELTTAFGTLLVLAVILVYIASAREPLAGLSPLGAIACGALALFALWTLLSSNWSHSSGRALIAFDRALLYLAILALFACMRRSLERYRWLLRGLLAAAVAISLVALTSRLLPALLPTTPGPVSDRLSYPLTYWNTFALLVGFACILAAHHTSDEREPAAVRIGAAAALPLLAATLLLTFSRGAIAVTVFSVAVYIVLARPRGLLGGALAALPAIAIALVHTYSASLIHPGTPLTPAAIDQAHHLALILGACAVGAGILRALSLTIDARVARLPAPSPRAIRVARVAAVSFSALVLAGFVVGGGVSALHRQYENFVNDTHTTSGIEGQPGRLLAVGNDGRLPLWNVARDDAFGADALKGTGAGTYQLQWQRHRSENHERLYAYSLYFETIGELGLVGGLLLAICLLTILLGIGLRLRGPGRPVYAAGFAVTIAWLLHAGVDIDWQTPAVCVPVFALGGLALARPSEGEYRETEPERTGAPSRLEALARLSTGAVRPLLALICLAIAVVPAQIAIAQSHLHDSIEALNAGSCSRVRSDANDAISAIGIGPRPYEVLAMCAARDGDPAAALRWAKAGVARDPNSWEPHYVLGLAQGSAGADPRPAIAAAEKLNPRSQLLQEAATKLDHIPPKQWRSVTLSLPFAFY
jgi:hypothetical protein